MWRAIALLLCLGSIAGCDADSETIRYHAFAWIKIGDTVHRGSVVRETTYTDTPNSLSGFALSVSDSGEALTVELGDGRPAIFILTRSRTASGAFPIHVATCFTGEPSYVDIAAKLRQVKVGQACQLDAGQLRDLDRLLVVAFKDESDPKSIFDISSGENHETFRKRPYLLGISFQRVDRNVDLTKEVERRLLWIKDFPFKGSTQATLNPSKPGEVGPMRDAPLSRRVSKNYFTGN